MLILPIKKKWFDMIKSGEKKEEYREIKPYYESRFMNLLRIRLGEFKDSEYVLFRNGYKKDSPLIKCLVSIQYGYGKEEWGAEPNKKYYVLKILSVEEINNG